MQSTARDPYKLSAELASWDVPNYEPFAIGNSFDLMRALVAGSTHRGQFYAEPHLMRRLFWWADTGITSHDIETWLAELIEGGEVTVEVLAHNSYGSWHPVVTIQNKRRFARWRPRKQIPDAVRAKVYARDNHTCRSCGSTDDLSVDHILPISKGGEDEMTNYQTLCRPCNSRKGARILG